MLNSYVTVPAIHSNRKYRNGDEHDLGTFLVIFLVFVFFVVALAMWALSKLSPKG